MISSSTHRRSRQWALPAVAKRGYHAFVQHRRSRDDVQRAMRVVLCGMRDLRDYRMGAAGSPFNIAAASLRLGDFSRAQTLALLTQHPEDTGRAFATEALEAVWTQARGQPWLVNALARIRPGEREPVSVTGGAKERLRRLYEAQRLGSQLVEVLGVEQVGRVVVGLLTELHQFGEHVCRLPRQ